jgi:hypothetical protein
MAASAGGRSARTSSAAIPVPYREHGSPVTNPFMLNPGALTCGANPGSAVTDE